MAEITKIRLSGQTYDIVDESALHTLDTSVTSGGTNAVDGGAVYDAIAAALESVAEQGYQTSGDVQSAISGKANTEDVITEVSAYTQQTTTAFPIKLYVSSKKGNITTSKLIANFDENDFKLSADTISINGDNIAKKTDIPSVTSYADAVAYDSTGKTMNFYHGGTGGTVVFSFDASPFIIDGMVENVEIKTLSGASYLVVSFNTDAGKQDINIPLTDIFDPSNYYTKTATDDAIEAATSGKADTSAVTAEIAAAVSGKADSDSLATVATTGSYNDLEDKPTIPTVPTDVSAFNNDAGYITADAITGKADVSAITTIQSAITSIQSAMTEDEEVTAAALNDLEANKQDKLSAGTGVDITNNVISVTGAPVTVDQTIISGSTNPVAGGAVYDALQGKQETLVSGTNIKTIGNESVLGSGNIKLMTASIGTGNDSTTLIFDFA